MASDVANMFFTKLNVVLCCRNIEIMKIIQELYIRPVTRFQDLVGHNTSLWGQDFCFYCMFKTNFSGRNKIWGGTAPKCPP